MPDTIRAEVRSSATGAPILLTSDYAKRLSVQAIPGAYFDDDPVKGWYLLDPTPRAAAVALRVLPELSLDHPELVEQRDKLRQDVRPFDNATAADLHIHDEADLAQYYAFQDIDLGYLSAVLKRHGGAYLGWERGLGKTLGACALAAALGCGRTLVVAPNTSKSSVWKPEVERWLPAHSVYVLPNDGKKRDAMMQMVWKGELPEPFVLIIHYEALSIIAGVKRKGRTRTVQRGWDRYGEWDMVIADEVHRIKDSSTLMARSIKKIPTKYKVALSGSIIMNHAEELFSPFQWLFPDTYKQQWRDWNDRYLDYVEGGFGKICIGVKQETLAHLREELGVFMVYRRKEDELDLPEKVEQTIMVDLTPAQRRAYDDLVGTCVAELESGERIKAADGLVMLGKLRQVATGLGLVSNAVEDSSKLDLAVEMVSDNPDEAFVIFTWYKASAYELVERLGRKGVFCVTGDTKQADRAEAITRFQAGDGRVFVGTLATIGESITLHRAQNAILIDRHWNPAMNDQAKDRIYRIGQKNAVTITDIVARNTVDELRVLPTLANKEALRRTILGGL